jgi:hypothetical protein
VAVVDDVADTGETLALVAAAVRRRGARAVVTAALAAHSWAEPMPAETALVSDALLVLPWDARVLLPGGRAWGLHPELEQALALQGDRAIRVTSAPRPPFAPRSRSGQKRSRSRQR